MTRAQRRAAMRQSAHSAAQAQKTMAASANAGNSSEPQPTDTPLSPANISDARLAANRENAQHSSGPRTEAGKARSSMNALKTGLTGQTVLLPSDDSLAYQKHLDRHYADAAPATDQEKTLVQLIADTEWRLLRIMPLEASLLAIGREQCAHLVADIEDPAVKNSLLMGQVSLTFRKELNNLHLQERRLRNQRKSDLAELLALQQERRAREEKAAKERNSDINRANKAAASAQTHGIEFNPLDHGFEFSTDEMAAFNEKNRIHTILFGQPLDFPQWLAAGKERKEA